MRNYAVMVPRFWVAGSGKKLRGDPEAQALANYLMNCPHGNMIGLFVIALPTIQHELGWDPRAALKRLGDPAIAIAFYDEEAELMWLPNAARYQVGESLSGRDKRRAMVVNLLEHARGHRFVTGFIDLYGVSYGIPGVSQDAPSVPGLQYKKPLPVLNGDDGCPPVPVPVLDPDPGGAGVADPRVAAMAEELRRHRHIRRTVPDIDHLAEQCLGQNLTADQQWLVQAMRDAAAELPESATDDAIRRKCRTFAKNARPPKAAQQPADDTPVASLDDVKAFMDQYR